MKLEVEICANWNGRDKVCDLRRCKTIYGVKWSHSCYHKPYVINGKRRTVIEALEILFSKKEAQ